jgi:hypothetical protein
MKLLASIVLIAGFAMGCRKAAEPAGAESKPAPTGASVAALTENAPPPPPPGGVPAAAITGEEGAGNGPRVQPMDVESLNTVISDYMAAKERIPKDFAEMVRLKLIPHVPKPPPGYKYEIDQVRGKIVVKKL